MEYRKNNYRPSNRYKNNYYNYTSVAHDYAQDYDNNRKINKRIKKIKKDKYINVEKGLKVFSFKFVITLMILTTFIIGIIFIEALIVQRKFEIDSLNANLKKIIENNKNLETELVKNLDLEYVENIASFELAMQKPSTHQIVHIKVPKESYSQKNDNKKPDTFLDKFKNLFKN